MKVLVTGGAGFIGSAITKKLVERGDHVIIIDNFNDYYDPKLKRDRLKIFLKDCKSGFTVYKGDIRDMKFLERVFKKEKPEKIIHLAAMAGVRYAIEHPLLYVDVNIVGTTNLLDIAVRYKVKNFVYASSSSIYGLNKPPFSEKDFTDTPISPYAATKKATELLAHCFSHIHGLKTTGLRFFTVYGPWGRPDMGVFKFIENIIRERMIDVYNFGKMKRNFTYIDDIVSGVITVLDADLPCGVMNIGGDNEVALMDYITTVEKYTGKKAKKNMMPMQPGDMASTVADIRKLRKLGWKPNTRIEVGVKNFIDWYRNYYKIQ